MVLGEATERVADRSGHAGASPLGGASDGAVPSSEADGAGELGDEVVAIVLGEFEPTEVVETGGLLDVLVDVERVGVGRPRGPGRRGGEVRSRRRRRGRPRHRPPSAGTVAVPSLDGDEVEHVELATRFGEQSLDVAEALEVAHGTRVRRRS